VEGIQLIIDIAERCLPEAKPTEVALGVLAVKRWRWEDRGKQEEIIV
jgi:hypothetical protein